jgi:hypothetical protein
VRRFLLATERVPSEPTKAAPGTSVHGFEPGGLGQVTVDISSSTHEREKRRERRTRIGLVTNSTSIPQRSNVGNPTGCIPSPSRRSDESKRSPRSQQRAQAPELDPHRISEDVLSTPQTANRVPIIISYLPRPRPRPKHRSISRATDHESRTRSFLFHGARRSTPAGTSAACADSPRAGPWRADGGVFLVTHAASPVTQAGGPPLVEEQGRRGCSPRLLEPWDVSKKEARCFRSPSGWEPRTCGCCCSPGGGDFSIPCRRMRHRPFGTCAPALSAWHLGALGADALSVQHVGAFVHSSGCPGADARHARRGPPAALHMDAQARLTTSDYHPGASTPKAVHMDNRAP